MNKETSLASQLRKLEAPQTNSLRDTKYRASFLYDRKEALSIDKDTHFIIGSTGFRQICSIDGSLVKFEELFSVINKDFDRAVKSKEENDKLNQLIRSFLFQAVSPYFLLTHTHKMLEWLIYRYSIHEYNLDDLIISVLPYHETKLFPRIVRLSLKIRDPINKWHWLSSVSKHSIPLPKVSLIAYLKTSSVTIEYLKDSIIETVKSQHKIPAVVSFFTSTLVTLLEDDFVLTDTFKDKYITIILSYLFYGTKSRDRGLVQSCYIVLSQLVTRVTLKVSKLEKLLSKMAKHLLDVSDSYTEKNFLLTLLIVYEFQELESIPEIVVKTLNLKRFIEINGQIQSKYFLTSLLTYYIGQCEDDDQYLNALMLIDNLKISSWTISKILEAVVALKPNPDSDAKSKLSNIVQVLERRFPSEFDGATSKSTIKGLENLIISPFYTKLNDKNVNVFVGLTSANEGIRLHSACHIAKNHKEILKCTDEQTKQLIADSLVNTLHENNPLVLIELLSCRDLFIKMVPLADLIVYGKKLLPRCIEMIRRNKDDSETHNDWTTVRRSCFKLVSNLDFKEESQFWDLFVDYFIPLDETGLSLFSVIFETDIEKTNRKLFDWTKSIYTEQLKTFIANEDYGSSIDFVTQRIASYINKNPTSPLLQVLNQSGSENYRKQILGLCVIFHLLPLQTANDNYESINELSLTCISILAKLVDPSTVRFKKTSYEDADNFDCIKDFINSSINYLTKRRVTSSMVQLFVTRLLSHKKCSPGLKPWFWHLQTTENNYINGLFNFLCNNCHHEKIQAQPVFQSLLKLFVKEIRTFCPKFLVGLWVKTEDPLLQARALEISSHFMVENDFDEIELVSLCIALQSPHSAVRAIAVKLLDIDSKPSTFIQFLSQYKELLAGDPREISIAIAKYWTDNQPVGKIKLPSITFKNITKLIKQDPNTPDTVRVGLASMLRDYNNIDCLKLFLSLLHFQPTNLSERQLTYLAGRKIIEMLPVLDNSSNLFVNLQLRLNLQRLFTSDDYRPMLLNLFNNSYVKQLNDDSKRLLIECLLDVIQVHNDNYCRRKLRKFLTDGSLVSYIISVMIDSGGDLDDSGEDDKGSGQAKRRRLEKKIVLNQDSDRWKKIVMLLEIFASKEIFTGAEQLMGTVFKLLKENLLSEEQSSSEYFRSLLLVILSNCLNQPEIDLTNFELVYILESLRHARLRETRMQALTIINRISGHLKDDILRDIIVIFGFIGNDMIKCDDQYTHKILDDTMETIIPGLVMSSEDSQKKIIETFTDSFNDIPLHRRLYLFQKLTSLLGEEQFLWYIVYKLIRRSLEIEESRKFIQEFISALVTGFDATIQMTTINQLMSMCHNIVNNGSFEALGENHRFPELTNRVDFAKETILTIYLIVSSEDYVSAIAKSKWSNLEDLFNQLFETNLLLIDYCNKPENKANRGNSRLNRELLNVLEKVNVLLPEPEFISVIHRLLGSESLPVRRKALDLLNGRLPANKSKSKISMLRDFIKPIVKIVGDLKENKSDIQIVTSQTGLISIGILSKILQGDSDSIDFLVFALKSIVSLCEDRSQIANTNLIASMILCISQLVSCLKTDCLSLIPSVMSIILSTLKEESEVLLLSSLTALSKLTLYFGKYLSSDLCQLLISICKLDRNCSFTGMSIRVDKVIINIANEVPFRILIESLEEAFDQLDSSEPRYVCLTILHRGLKDCDKNEIEPNMVNLQKFALKLLDYRSVNCDSDEDIKSINKIEDKSLDAITSFVPKLSEASFRSFFYKVYDWVKTGDGNNNYHRVLTFYRLTNKLADKLKNLFSAFAAPYIVINCIKQLKAFHINSENGMLKLSNDNKTKTDNEQIGHLIISNILTTLAKSFQHDVASTFATPDRSKKLYPLILDQITNDFGPNDKYCQRIDEGVIPCIQHLVKSVNDHNIVKDANYQLLLKTRENSAKVRYQALHVLHQLILSMTEEYTPYIPEAVPFLAELHEDDSDEIQKLLLIVFGDIEKIFGEPINSYF